MFIFYKFCRKDWFWENVHDIFLLLCFDYTHCSFETWPVPMCDLDACRNMLQICHTCCTTLGTMNVWLTPAAQERTTLWLLQCVTWTPAKHATNLQHLLNNTRDPLTSDVLTSDLIWHPTYFPREPLEFTLTSDYSDLRSDGVSLGFIWPITAWIAP